MPSVLHRLAVLFAIAGGLVASAVALMVVTSVTGRAMLGTPIQGDVELTQFGIALSIALCLPWAQLHGSNIIVDFFTTGARERTQQVLDGVGALLLALMVGLLAWRTAAGAAAVYGAEETSMILGLPMWITYAVLSPGLALTAVIALVQMKLSFAGQAMRHEVLR